MQVSQSICMQINYIWMKEVCWAYVNKNNKHICTLPTANLMALLTERVTEKELSHNVLVYNLTV